MATSMSRKAEAAQSHVWSHVRITPASKSCVCSRMKSSIRKSRYSSFVLQWNCLSDEGCVYRRYFQGSGQQAVCRRRGQSLSSWRQVESGDFTFKDFRPATTMVRQAMASSMAYRHSAKLMHIDTFQYHPSGAVYPEQLIGALVTEGIRSEGGHLVNARGERFVNELDTRDVVSSSIIRECEEGRGIRTMAGRVGVWLDTPLLEAEQGPGTLKKHFPAMVLQYERFGIDISKDPVLIYPTLHYQNGGVKIDVNTASRT